MTSTSNLQEFLAEPERYAELDLNDQRIGDESAASLAQALAGNNRLIKLSLNYSKIKDAGGAAIGRALAQNSALQMLDMSNNQIGEEGIRAISEGLAQNRTLKELKLFGSNLGDEECRLIGQGLARNVALTTLDLRCSKIVDSGVVAITSNIRQNSALTKLLFWGNPIGNDGAGAILDVLRHNHILTITLSRNKIDFNIMRQIENLLSEEERCALQASQDDSFEEPTEIEEEEAKELHFDHENAADAGSGNVGSAYVQLPQDDVGAGGMGISSVEESKQRSDHGSSVVSSGGGEASGGGFEPSAPRSEPMSQEEFNEVEQDTRSKLENLTFGDEDSAALRDERQQAEIEGLQNKLGELVADRNATQLQLDRLMERCVELGEIVARQAEDRSDEINRLKSKVVQLDSRAEELRSDVVILFESQGFFDELRGKASILAGLVEEKTRQDARMAAEDEITSDSYKKAFYDTLCRELNAAYLSASAIDTGWIKNDKKGGAGYFGSFVKEASAVVPFVGGGVRILGSVLKMADSRHQEKMLGNYASIVSNVNDMDSLSRELAREILSLPLEFEGKKENMVVRVRSMLMNKAAEIVDDEVGYASALEEAAASEPRLSSSVFDLARNMLGAVSNLVLRDAAAEDSSAELSEYMVSSALDDVLELGAAAEEPLAGPETESQVKLGKEHAHKIAKIVIASILSGKFENKTQAEKIEVILDSVREEFTNHVTSAGGDDQASHGDQDTAQLLADAGGGVGKGGCCIVSYVTGITYDNKILNHPELLKLVANKYGSDALSKLTVLGMDKEVAEEILSHVQTQGADQVLDILFGDFSADWIEESSDLATECTASEVAEKLIGSGVGTADGLFAS